MFSALVLSAGLGTRLRPLTDELPKPLVPVGDRPLLVATLEKLLELGADSVAVNTHYHGDKIASAIEYLGTKVHVVNEVEIRGTAGGIAGARHLWGCEPLLVVNGDISGSLPGIELVARATDGLVLGVTPAPLGLGTVGIGALGQVVRLRGRTFGNEVRSGDYVGMAVLGRALVDALPLEGCLIGDVALPLLDQGRRIDTLELSGAFSDVGSLTGYLDGNVAWLRDRGAQAFVGLGASVGQSVELEGSVVGAGAEVVGVGKVEQSVIWPGARAVAPLNRAVVTRRGLVQEAGAR